MIELIADFMELKKNHPWFHLYTGQGTFFIQTLLFRIQADKKPEPQTRNRVLILPLQIVSVQLKSICIIQRYAIIVQ